MPKQVQFTKEIIIKSAIEIIRSEGIDALTARSLSKKLGCSVAPIFHKYANMEELAADVRKAAGRIVSDYLADAVNYEPAFKEFGLRLVCFSKEEPNLFRYLFLDGNGSSVYVDAIAEQCLVQTKLSFGVTDEQASFVYTQIWPFVCGLAQLCCKDPEVYTDGCISQMLSTQFQSLMMLVKSGREVMDVDPHLIPEGKRVYLRKWRESDGEALYGLASDPDLGPRAGWPAHRSVEESREIIRNVFNKSATWAIILKETNELVGCMGYFTYENSNIQIGENDCEAGYWVGKPYWNQGICTEALEIMLDYCKRVKHFDTVWSDHFIDNPASGRVMEKCGFTDTGQRRTCPGLMVGSEKEVRVLKLKL